MRLSQRLLDMNRTRYEAGLPDTAAVRRVEETNDGSGGIASVDAFGKPFHAKAVPDRSPKETVEGERITALSSFRLLVPYGTEIKPGDQIVVVPGRNRTVSEIKTATAARVYDVVKPATANGDAFGLIVPCEQRE